ncbi:hypothetical protein NDU88_000804 [Pleurodeles waltl]|uniref:Uncharacterized protein n=1 Tax=Pleurodeles waltl TaxID=8319 RepID=A0AAV7N8Z6_PLEWA|nr:hypothetical protein NDU88_000804 [Pleurodeles waltl]
MHGYVANAAYLQKVYKESECAGKLLAWQTREHQMQNTFTSLFNNETKTRLAEPAQIYKFLRHYKVHYGVRQRVDMDRLKSFLSQLSLPKLGNFTPALHRTGVTHQSYIGWGKRSQLHSAVVIDKEDVNSDRPISLLNADYKIIEFLKKCWLTRWVKR